MMSVLAEVARVRGLVVLLVALRAEQLALPALRLRCTDPTVAIEALRAVLDRLGTAFGENEAVLRQALGQLQMTFVQLKEQVTEGATEAP